MSTNTKPTMKSLPSSSIVREEVSKRLYRSETDRMLAGVCGGIAEYFGWDSTLVRLIFILIILLGGSGVLVYLVLWFILPTESDSTTDLEKRFDHTTAEIKTTAKSIQPVIQKTNRSMWGVFFIGFGVLLLLQNFGIGRYLQLEKTWPIVLVILGFMILGK